MTWKPSLGAWMENGIRFRVWAPEAKSIELFLEGGGSSPPPIPLEPSGDGFFSARVDEAKPGDRYRYRIDGDRALPDPASRFQPEGVHGPSEIVDPSRFSWTDSNWRGIPLESLILYELHAGTFTPEGTFRAITERLPYLKNLGITAIELMPLGDFPGNRNWGYDGVDLFAPARCYGQPDDLRLLVDTAHNLELAVVLDVVYNHLGPEGAYLGAFSPFYFSSAHQSPWGDAINLDGEQSGPARDFFIENALHWIHEYHMDGLRLDATHAMFDNSSIHFLQELADRVRASLPKDRTVLIIAEDDRNLARIIRAKDSGGYGLDAVWTDDFHHQLRRMFTGDDEAFYQDFTDQAADLAEIVQRGWLYSGQHSAFRNAPRGTDPKGIPSRRFIHYIQNHDQVANRATGERLNTQIDLAAYRAASALLMFSPATPLLFMGQEWASEKPFCFFTDHPEELGRRVTEGRRKEFRHFKAFKDPQTWPRIPDPQAEETFQSCKLDWEERKKEPHAGILNLYRALIDLRRNEPALSGAEGSEAIVEVLGENMIAMRRKSAETEILIIACLKGTGRAELGAGPATKDPEEGEWSILFSTEDNSSARLEQEGGNRTVHFDCPGAVILRPAGKKS